MRWTGEPQWGTVGGTCRAPPFGAERGHLLRKLLAGLDPQALDPRLQRREGGGVQSRDLGVVELESTVEATSGPMQDLVRIGVADSREQARIRERAFERVVLAPQAAPKLSTSLPTSNPPRSKAANRLSPATTCRAARFLVLASVSANVPVANSKLPDRSCGRPRAAAGLLPMESPGDHEVHEQEELVLEAEDDCLPIRCSDRTSRPWSVVKGGCTVRSTKGLWSWARTNFCPTTSGSSRSR